MSQNVAYHPRTRPTNKIWIISTFHWVPLFSHHVLQCHVIKTETTSRITSVNFSINKINLPQFGKTLFIAHRFKKENEWNKVILAIIMKSNWYLTDFFTHLDDIYVFLFSTITKVLTHFTRYHFDFSGYISRIPTFIWHFPFVLETYFIF